MKSEKIKRMNEKNELTLRSHGKVLLTGEYVVLKGAKALALPVKFGQVLKVETVKDELTRWESLLKNRKVLLRLVMKKDLSAVEETYPDNAGNEIIKILQVLKELHPGLFGRAYRIETKFEFDLSLGLGSSSTLIANLSKWAQVNPFELLDRTFNGSGYDVVTSLSGKPVLFQKTGYGRQWQFVKFYPKFHKHLFFIHLNKKQSTYQAVRKFMHVEISGEKIGAINAITEEILAVNNLSRFQELIDAHDKIIGKIIRKKPVKQRLFPDYPGAIKSLGAWGGDMILAAGDPDTTPQYFQERGYKTVFPFAKLILKT